jgi:hypothetical protein
MPRGSKPGERRGGRQRGTPNKKTALKNAALAAAGAACPQGYGPRQARNDRNRLHSLHCKRLSPPSCGGGTLNPAESAEEAELLARVLAFEQSPEGLATHRIFELGLQTFGRVPSAAEQIELDNLRKLHPDVGMHCDDPLRGPLERLRPGR